MRGGAQDRVRFDRPLYLPGLELVSATYGRRSFPVHSHPEYVVGAVVEGAERLSIGGSAHVVAAGTSLFINPGEAHANATIGDGPLTYRVFYIPPALIHRPLDGEKRSDPLAFDSPTVRSAALFRTLVGAHLALSGGGDALEQESAYIDLVAAVTRRSGRPPGVPPPCAAGVRRARDHLDAHFRDGPCLADLARVADLSPFHLLRSFRRRFGLSPAAYRNQLRVMEARRLLRAGAPIAAVAAEVGFADQSHLTRQFQRLMGTTPGRYAQQ